MNEIFSNLVDMTAFGSISWGNLTYVDHRFHPVVSGYKKTI